MSFFVKLLNVEKLYPNPIVRKPDLLQTTETLQKNPEEAPGYPGVHEKSSVVTVIEEGVSYSPADIFCIISKYWLQKLNAGPKGSVNPGYYLKPNPHACHPG